MILSKVTFGGTASTQVSVLLALTPGQTTRIWTNQARVNADDCCREPR